MAANCQLMAADLDWHVILHQPYASQKSPIGGLCKLKNKRICQFASPDHNPLRAASITRYSRLITACRAAALPCKLRLSPFLDAILFMAAAAIILADVAECCLEGL